MKNLVEVYCLADNFVNLVEQKKLGNRAGRKSMLAKADYITLAIMKQQYCIKTTKQLYEFVKAYMQKDFPPLPCYQQFNEGIKSTCRYLMMITSFLTNMNKQKGSDKHIVDSTPLTVCNNNYRFLAKIFKGLASSGKNMNGWFWGFKLHLIINLNMEIESITISGGSTSDSAVLGGDFIEGLRGWLVGDKGYISPEKADQLAKKGLNLITKPLKNMKKPPMTSLQNYLLSKRQMIESTISTLKHRLLLINHYARSIEGYFVNIFAAIITYSINLKSSKSKFKNMFNHNDFSTLAIS
jgi:hypothetical protein